MQEIIFDNAFIFVNITQKPFEDVSETDPFVSLVEKQQTIPPTAHGFNQLNLGGVAEKRLLSCYAYFLLPLVGREQPERVEIFDVFPLPAKDPMSAEFSEIVEVQDAGVMVQRFDLISGKDAFNRDAEISAPIDQINIGKRHITKLQHLP